ncbi:MAG: reprolysin-like metallopeptidase [Planctomycetota bacterium]
MKRINHPFRSPLAGLVACALAGALGAQHAPRQIRIEGSHGPLNTTSAIPVTGATLGELAYRLADHTPGSYLVDVDFSVLDRVDPEVENRIALTFEDERYEIVLLQVETRGPRRHTWLGQVAGITSSEVILVRHEEGLVLTVNDLSGRGLIELQGMTGGLYRIGRHQTAGGHCGTPSTPLPRLERLAPAGQGQPEAGALPPTPEFVSAGTDPDNVIDVLIVPSDEALSSAGSEAQFLAKSFSAVAGINLRLANSGVNLTTRLCAVPFADASGYSESSSMSTNLDNLTYTGTTYSGLDALQANRDDYRPDIMALVVSENEPVFGGEIQGIGWRPATTGQLTTTAGYFVTSLETMTEPTFAHEFGHNLGACHNAGQDGCSTAITTSPHGIRKTCGLFGEWEFRTTMSYSEGQINSQQVSYFSTEGITLTLTDGLGLEICDFDIWDGVSKVSALFDESRPIVADYNIGSNQLWVQQDAGTDVGTYVEPMWSIADANAALDSSVTDNRIRVWAGAYNETTLAGGAVTLSTPCTISGEGGNLIIQ